MKEFMIKKEIKFCPNCELEHEVILKKMITKGNVKGIETDYEFYFYFCEECSQTFEDGELLEKNLLSMRDSYRKKNNLLTKNEIVAIREKYKLTQEDLSKILDLGEKTITRYETTTIQDRPYDTLLRKFNEDYNFAYEMLLKSKNKFNHDKFIKISQCIRGFILMNSSDYYNDIKLKNQYILQEDKTSTNGFTLLNVPKIKSMIAYFAKFTKNLFMVKLMKLLWYSDALAFLRTGTAMTGLVYTHMPMGALPIGYKEVCELNSVEKEAEEICENIVFRFVPKDSYSIDESLFTIEELSILNEICKQFGELSGKQLSEIMHKEDIYKYTEEKEVLDFSLIKNLKAMI